MKLEPNFRHNRADYSVVLHGENAAILKVDADYLDCESLEVWKIVDRPETTIAGRNVEAGVRKWGDEYFPSHAKQFLLKRYSNYKEMLDTAHEAYWRWENKEDEG